MGKSARSALIGGSKVKKPLNLLTPEQQSYLSKILNGNNADQASNAYSDFLQPYDPAKFQEMFNKSFVEPGQQQLNRQIIPGLKENFLGLDESGSSSLNRALAQSATDLSTALGQQQMNLYNQQNANRLSALSGLGGASGQQTFTPHVQQQQGVLGPILGLGQNTIGGGFFNKFF